MFQKSSQDLDFKSVINILKLKVKKKTYFLKIKNNLKKEIENNRILKQILSVPNIYRYDKTSDNNYEYVIEDYIDGISLYDIAVSDSKYDSALFLAGQAMGRAFNIKIRQVGIDQGVSYTLDTKDKSIYNKYFFDNTHNGFVLLDVEYLYSIVDNKESIFVIDLENCLYDDIRPYLNTYGKIYGESFISGFNSSSNISYCDLIINDMAEYMYIRKKIENRKNNYPN